MHTPKLLFPLINMKQKVVGKTQMKYIKSEVYLLKYLIIKENRWQVHFDMIPLNVTFYIVFILQNYTETLCAIQRFGLK